MVRIHGVKVRDLGPIRDAEIPGAPVVLFMGPNESGKSTLLHALEVLYFGTRDGVPVKDSRDLVREGEEGYEIEAKVQVGDDQSQDMAETLRATRTQRPLQSHLAEIFGDPRVFRALQDVEKFLFMPAKDRQELLAALVAGDSDALADLLESEGAGPTVVAKVRSGDMRGAHNQAVKDRRAVSATVKALEEMARRPVEDPDVPTKGGPQPVSQVPIDKVLTAIEKLDAMRSEALQSHAKREQYEILKEKADESRKELEDLKADLVWEDGDESRRLEITRTLEDRRRKVMAARESATRWRQEADRVRDLLQKGTCPTCSTSFDAKKPPAHMRALLDQAEANLQEETTAADVGAGTLKGLEDEKKAMEKRKGMAESNATYRRRLEERIQTFESLPEPEAGSTVPLQSVEENLERMNTIRRARERYDQDVVHAKKAKQNLARHKESLGSLQHVENLTDPRKIEGEEEVLEKFNVMLTEAATVLFPMHPEALRFEGWDLTLYGRSISLASTSAQMRAGLACSLALARLSEVGLLFLDRIESMDDATRRTLLALLKKALDEGWIMHAWLAAVKKDPRASADVPWLAWVRVQQGTTAIMKKED